MREIEELTERMDGADELINSLIKKITDLEKKEVKVTDYSLHFEAVQKIFEVFLVRFNQERNDLNAAFGKLNIEYPVEQIQQGLGEIKTVLNTIQNSLPVKIKHHFDFNTKGWIIAGMILLIVTSISIGICGNLWVENNRLGANDIKFRAIKQIYPIPAKWADNYYTKNPKAMEDATEQLESKDLEPSESTNTIADKREGNSIRNLRRTR